MTAPRAPHLAISPTHAFVTDLLGFGESYEPEVGDRIRDEDNDLEGQVVSKADGVLSIRDDQGNDHTIEADWLTILSSKAIDAVWEDHLRGDVPDGVAFSDAQVSVDLNARLNAHIERLMSNEPEDFHPGSGERVRDLVHPSLYPYVKGKSVTQAALPAAANPEYDRFGRTFESSIYQWLPTPFRIDENGSVRIDSYINNLDQTRYSALYTDLAALFSCALPLIESVLGYVQATKFWVEDCAGVEHEGDLPEVGATPAPAAPPERRSVRGRELLVIPKIVEYKLTKGDTHEGVWHVEGMSHEHIVATCIYVAERDEALTGGALRFKRSYTLEEAGQLFWTVDQSRPAPVERLVDEGTIPAGSVETPRGRLLVFPNSHIHKLSPLELNGLTEEGRRRVIVFWIVDPDVRIPSTREIAPQQNVFSRSEALEMRLALMEERRRHKQTLNIRSVSLCEH